MAKEISDVFSLAGSQQRDVPCDLGAILVSGATATY